MGGGTCAVTTSCMSALIVPKYGLVESGARVVRCRAIDTIVSVQFANGPEAVPGFICRRASSNGPSSSCRNCAAGGGMLGSCPWDLVVGGGCRRFGNSSVLHLWILGGVSVAVGVLVVSFLRAAL